LRFNRIYRPCPAKKQEEEISTGGGTQRGTSLVAIGRQPLKAGKTEEAALGKMQYICNIKVI